MRVYTYFEAREKLSSILEEAKTEEIVIKCLYTIVPRPARPRRSPFDIKGLKKKITREEILQAIRESRDRT